MSLQRKWDRYKYLSPIFLLIIFLFSCSTSPEYKIEKLYLDGNKECIKTCQTKKLKCEKQCKSEYEKCINTAYKRAKETYNILVKQYEKELKIYNSLFDKYLHEYDQWFSKYSLIFDSYQYYRDRCQKDKKDSYSCYKYNQLKSELEHLRYLKPYPPNKPTPPDFKKILQDEKNNCINRCSKCEEQFDICFTTCGGKISIKKICVKNCDKQK